MRQQEIEIGNAKYGVLRVNEHAEVVRNAQRDKPLAAAAIRPCEDAAAENPVHQGRDKNHTQKYGFAPTVENQAAEQKDSPAKRQKPIKEEKDGQENKEEKGRRKKHGYSIRSGFR